MKVNVFYKVPIPASLKKTGLFKSAVLAGLGKFAKLNGVTNVIFVCGARMRNINKKFLSHDYVTDVITFPYPFDKKNKAAQAFGDIFICYNAALQNAALYNNTALEEMLTYAAHGALHLAGMDDDTPAKRARMDAAAEKIIKEIMI